MTVKTNIKKPACYLFIKTHYFLVEICNFIVEKHPCQGTKLMSSRMNKSCLLNYQPYTGALNQTNMTSNTLRMLVLSYYQYTSLCTSDN